MARELLISGDGRRLDTDETRMMGMEQIELVVIGASSGSLDGLLTIVGAG